MGIRDQLREHLVRTLRQFWRLSPAEFEGRTVPSDGMTEELADEMLDNLPDSPDDFSPFGADQEVPLVVKLRPRGTVEDDWSARPTPERPWPVVLLHGTGQSNGDFQELTSALRADGWVVFAPSYGIRATSPIEVSAEFVGAYLTQVLQATGAEKLILLGHSQGGLVARYWMRFLGGARHTHHFVGLSVPHLGTTIGGLASPIIRTERGEEIALKIAEAAVGPVVHQMLVDSEFITRLNGDDPLDDGVTYTCIATRSDSLVQPPESGFLPAPDDDPHRVHNIWVQDLEPHSVVLHEQMPFDQKVRRLVLAALRRVAAGAPAARST